MDVINADQARIAEEAGACAVMALERVPADIRKEGGVARMVRSRRIKNLYVLMVRRTLERSQNDQRDRGCCYHSRNGQGPNWPFC
jgi:hypothetical protein